MSPTTDSMITSSTHKTDAPLIIMKVYLRFNESKILTIYYSIDVICDLSLSEVLDASLGILPNNVIKYCETSLLLDSYTKASIKEELASRSFSLTILHEEDKISIRKEKILHTVISQIIASSSPISLTSHMYSDELYAKNRSKHKSEFKSNKKPSSSKLTKPAPSLDTKPKLDTKSKF